MRSYDQTIRQWCLKFGQTYANELKYRRSKPGDAWHPDEYISRSPARLIISGALLISVEIPRFPGAKPDAPQIFASNSS